MTSDLADGLDQLLASQSIELAGKAFASQTELTEFVEKEVLANLAFADCDVEITNEQHREILTAIFKHSSENFCTSNIQKIVYGQHATSGGALGSFMVSRLVPAEASADDFQKQREDSTGKTFAVPSRRVVASEAVSYVDSIRKLFVETVFCREQGYIQSVNGMYFPCYFAALEGLVRRYPLLQHDILASLIKHFPHHRSEKLLLVCSARNLLSLAIALPVFEQQVIQFTISLLINLDCELRSGKNREKIDQIMEVFILYINFKLGVDSHAPKETRKQLAEVCPLEGVQLVQQSRAACKPQTPRLKEGFVQLLLSIFSEKLVKVEKPNIVHFLYYYISSLSGEFDWIKEAFLEQLILNLHDKSLQKQIKLHSLYYLFSFLRASNFLTGLIMHTALTYLIDFLQANYHKYIKRHPQLMIRKMTADDIKKAQVRRVDATENTSPIRDDIFIFCFQSCLDLFVTKKHLLSEDQLADLTQKFDQLAEKTKDFIGFCITESETFFQLFKNLRDHTESSKTRAILDDMSVFSQSGVAGSRFVSPYKKPATDSTIKKIILRDIDYLPFRPLRMRFYQTFIAPYILPACFSDSAIDRPGSPFDSSLSLVETSATEQHASKPTSHLNKRPPCYEDRRSPQLPPGKKYST